MSASRATATSGRASRSRRSGPTSSVAALRWTYMGEDGPGAGFFPLWYGGVMVVLSLALVAGRPCSKRPAQSAVPAATG